MLPENTDWPATVEEAAERLVASLDAKARHEIHQTSEEDLISFHLGLGATIRNTFGLWGGNAALLQSSGCADADDCSMKIIEAAWRKLHEADGAN